MAGSDGQRGYLIQSIIALLKALQSTQWDRLELEPKHESEKVDFTIISSKWKRAIQVKSSINQITEKLILQWARDLVLKTTADSYELILVGQCVPPFNRGGTVNNGVVYVPKTLDIDGMLHQAAHLLDVFLYSEDLYSRTPKHRELLVAGLITRLSILSSSSQTLERVEFTNLLKEWLNASNQPPQRIPRILALSRVPRSFRPNFGTGLIGREEDLTWLLQATGDRLISGQPGMGKTFLLQQMAQCTSAMFLTSNDERLIASELLAQSPATVLIEDASLNLDTIRFLQTHRRHLDLTFDIVADCWPGDVDELITTMRISASQVRSLGYLTDEEIVEIVMSSGIYGPNQLLHLIVGQSAGCPGRALMLVDACLQRCESDWNNVITGEKLAQWVRARFSALIGEAATEVLGCFSLGGNEGLSMDAASIILERSMPELRSIVRALALGGLIFDPQDGKLIVVPQSIRGILVRDTFFNSPASIPFSRVTDSIGVFPALVETIIESHTRGARISDHQLLRLVSAVDSNSVWGLYAYSSSDHADWILDNRKDLVGTLSEELLASSPLNAIAPLIEMAPSDSRPEHSAPDHPARRIRDWVESGRPCREAVSRRQVVLDAFRRYIDHGGDINLAIILVDMIVSPSFRYNEQVAGDRLKYRVVHGAIDLEDLSEIEVFWDTIFEKIDATRLRNWRPFLSAIQTWVFPFFGMNGGSPEQYAVIEKVARRVLERAVTVARGRPGVLTSLTKFCADFGVGFNAEVDPTFSILFPGRPSPDLDGEQSELKRLSANAIAAGKQFSEGDPDTIIRRIQRCIDESLQMLDAWPDFSTTVVGSIASENIPLVPWIDAVISLRARADLLTPLIAAALRKNELGVAERFETALSDDLFRFEAIRVGLICDVPETLRRRTMEECPHFPDLVKHVTMLNDLGVEKIRELLTHEDSAVVSNVLEGLWHRQKQHPLREELRNTWRQAAVRHLVDEWCLHGALEADPDFRMDWLTAQCEDHEQLGTHRRTKDFQIAIRGATDDDRKKLLTRIEPSSKFAGKIVRAVVGDSSELYRALWALPMLRSVHAVPLQRPPDNIWETFVRIAVEHRMSREAIMHSSRKFPTRGMRKVPSSFYEEIGTWTALTSHQNPDIAGIAKLALKEVESDLEFWKKRERRERLR